MDQNYQQEMHREEPAVENYANSVPVKPKKKRIGFVITACVLAALLVGGAGGAFLMSIFGDDLYAAVQGSRPGEQGTGDGEEDLRYALDEVPISDKIQTAVGDKTLTPASVYANNVGAVVGISTETTATNVFGQQTSRASAGSGFVVTEDGYVVTNYHVISGANTITVTLYSGEKYTATLVGGYADNDVALLKIDAQGLQHVTVGSTEDLVVGEMIVAIGNPLGELTYTMTVGYVSAMDREINIDGTPINMLQTDVAINSGNSGGPVFDMNGNVIGIAAAKYSGQTGSGAYMEGLGFAIPMDDVLEILFDLGTYGYVTGQPYLGVNLEELDSSTAKTYGLPVGPIVTGVEAGSAAEKAGIQTGDIILALNGRDTETYSDLKAALKECRAGEQVTVTVFRGGQRVNLAAVLDEKLVTVTPETEQEQTQDQEQQIPGFNPDSPYNYYDYYDFFNYFFGMP